MKTYIVSLWGNHDGAAIVLEALVEHCEPCTILSRRTNKNETRVTLSTNMELISEDVSQYALSHRCIATVTTLEQ